MIDTHAHLVHSDFSADLPAVISRAFEAGVERIINVGFDLESSRRAVEQAEQHANLFATVGVHPHDATKWTDTSYNQLRALASHPKVVAVGETGMDFHYDFSPRSSQEEVFRAIVRLSLETGLPLVIHCREADDQTMSILKEVGEQGVRGVFHCFTGDTTFARECVEAGFYLGFTGIVTYKKSDALRQVVAEVPLDRLLVETDCPYLAPQESRGQRNEPANVLKVAERIAGGRGESVSTIGDATTHNANRLFFSR